MERARNNEDDFDTYLSALGILRLLLENVSLEDETLRLRTCEQGRPLLDGIAEGGMLGILATQLELKQSAFVVRKSADASDSMESAGIKPRAQRKPKPPGGAWVRVTSDSIENCAEHQNKRQISFSGLPKGTKDIPVWVEIECKGRSYSLTTKDHTAYWRGHQISTAEDFEALYDLLSTSPDTYFPVELIEDRLPTT